MGVGRGREEDWSEGLGAALGGGRGGSGADESRGALGSSTQATSLVEVVCALTNGEGGSNEWARMPSGLTEGKSCSVPYGLGMG